MGSLQRLSDLLLSSTRGLSDPVERGTARLLSACLLGITAVFAAVDVFFVHTRAEYVPPWQGYLLLLVAYALSRGRYYRLGATLATAMFPLVALSIVLSESPQGVRAFTYAMLAPFFAGLFLGVRGAAAFAVLTPLTVGVLPWMTRFTFSDVFDTLAATIMGGLVAVSYAFHRDWVERRRREVSDQHEAELIHMQKMEALGRMAGGIAHDFNNLLTVISGATELLGRHSQQKELRLIESATRSAQDLTERLLTLSRQQIVLDAVADVGVVLERTQQLLSRIIGEDIELFVHIDPSTGAVALGEGQLQQVLLNLATNSRDAMPRGGKLTFEALAQGESVLLVVRDTGVGMDEKTRARVFEPFFTTKGVGEGTGLGLAMVFGLVNQAGGGIEVESAPGRGTTFRLLLPCAGPSEQEVPVRSERRLTLDGMARGRILLVEDDSSVRELCRSVLRREGYEVVEAAQPKEALQLIDESDVRFDLLITDVVMPGMSGPELVEALRQKDSTFAVLFMSGYAPEDAVGRKLEAREFLPKPFRPTDLLRRVSAALYGLESQSPPASEKSNRPIDPIPQMGELPTVSTAGARDQPFSATVQSGSRRMRQNSEVGGPLDPKKKVSSDN